MAAEVTPAIQDDGVAPTVTPIADVEMYRQRNIIQRLERQSKQTHWRIRQNYRHRRPDQPRPTAPPPPLSRQILAVNVANISNKRPAIATSSGTPGSGPSQRPASLHQNFALLSLDSMSSSIQPRDLDAEESPSVSHRALVAMNMVVQLAQ
ncbi:hypothetical protein BASA60_007480 [Batrachochytrium salamandrivorans]|nr:hypothetical protein BASA60_007480 [Batrachochytrium salamandrivorans]